jgi:hypothetical protein
MLWRIFAQVGDVNRRDPLVGANPYQIPSHYTGALFQLRRTETNPLITVQRVLIYGSLLNGAFPAVGLGIADQHVIARWAGNQGVGVGQLRQPKSIDGFVGSSRRKLNLIPPFLLVEWNTSAVGDGNATMEVWGSFIGPAVRGFE